EEIERVRSTVRIAPQLLDQSLQILRRVHVVPGRKQRNARAQRLRSGMRLLANGGTVELLPIEQRWPWPAGTNEIVPTVQGGAEHHRVTRELLESRSDVLHR